MPEWLSKQDYFFISIARLHAREPECEIDFWALQSD